MRTLGRIAATLGVIGAIAVGGAVPSRGLVRLLSSSVLPSSLWLLPVPSPSLLRLLPVSPSSLLPSSLLPSLLVPLVLARSFELRLRKCSLVERKKATRSEVA